MDWGFDWTDCCTVKSNINHVPPGALDGQPPKAPMSKASPPNNYETNAIRDPYHTPKFDERGTGVKDVYRFPSQSEAGHSNTNGSGIRGEVLSTKYSPQPEQRYNPRPASQTRPTSQIGQHTSSPSQQNVGLGIAFQQKLNASDTPRPKLAVKSLAVGSPAHACGQIQVGDVLHSIGDVYVKGMNGAEIAPFILGAPGSAIHMAFERPMPDGSFRMVHVDLTRTWSAVGTAPPAAQPVLLRQFGAN
eukprot:CAMPEP_0196736216 /NCGR_PEP_ID=MMETSP1091-20130531/14352_1 /TAXON_ID=302021 /ORGANISM="Rhodomonas sp., Strain CCMP768" /LENGTH=245 /DNA_ID=CAMNT_0042079921 /DNA_START=54 /DNA_END=791 /DNA_ORIENTATION=-